MTEGFSVSRTSAGRQVLVERRCKDCGAPLTHVGGKGRWPVRCPEHQAARRNEVNREKKARYRESALVGSPRLCADCATPLIKTSHKWPTRCSPCQVEQTKKRAGERRAIRVKPVTSCPDCLKPHPSDAPRRQGSRCAACAQIRGNQLAAEYRRKYPERDRAVAKAYRERHPDRVINRNHARRVATTGAESEQILTSVLLERDGTRCSLCPEEIDFELKWPHPGSKSLDHITPVAAGGSHTYDNVALAHLVCNISKNVGEAPKTTYADLVRATVDAVTQASAVQS